MVLIHQLLLILLRKAKKYIYHNGDKSKKAILTKSSSIGQLLTIFLHMSSLTTPIYLTASEHIKATDLNKTVKRAIQNHKKNIPNNFPLTNYSCKPFIVRGHWLVFCDECWMLTEYSLKVTHLLAFVYIICHVKLPLDRYTAVYI